MGKGSFLAILGGLIAIIGQFIGSNIYLSLIGGIIAIIGGLLSL
jgi:hypothetical protein